MSIMWLQAACLVSALGLNTVEGWFVGSRSYKTVCYGTLGCYSNRPPYYTSQGYLPKPPGEIGTRFLLYTRANKGNEEELLLNSTAALNCSWTSFNPLQPSKIIIHGYFDHSGKQWMTDMVRELLTKDDFNVMIVDWKHGADEYNYLQSAANIRVVGTQVAQMLILLEQYFHIDLASVHIIGHSLGAHAAGHAGEYLEGIGRITGLDPAGPGFRKTDPAVRLDPEDAMFVDVIHTDSEHLYQLGFGLKAQMGTLDFYPNGGLNQPGCPSTYFEQMKLMVTGNFEFVQNFGCSHLRAYEFFTESINSNCSFTAFPCPEVTTRWHHACSSCGAGCARMGFHADQDTAPGVYYLTTQSSSPFCAE